MMIKPRWLISVPVWRERCVEVFCATALPALERAMLRLGDVDARLICHTDSPDRIKAAATQIPIEAKPLPAGLRSFDCMSQAHRDVLAMACVEDRVALLTADLVLSEGSLHFCEQRLSQGDKWVIAVASIRALEEGHIDDTRSGRELMKWAWRNRHPITSESTWPEGKAADLSRLYFARDNNVVARWCLLHPFAIRIDGRPLRFHPTIDVNLLSNFHETEIHVVTNPDDVAMIELSPRDKEFTRVGNSMTQRFDDNQIVIPGGLQGWSFDHKIVICGQPVNCGDDELVDYLRDRL